MEKKVVIQLTQEEKENLISLLQGGLIITDSKNQSWVFQRVLNKLTTK